MIYELMAEDWRGRKIIQFFRNKKDLEIVMNYLYNYAGYRDMKLDHWRALERRLPMHAGDSKEFDNLMKAWHEAS